MWSVVNYTKRFVSPLQSIFFLPREPLTNMFRGSRNVKIKPEVKHSKLRLVLARKRAYYRKDLKMISLENKGEGEERSRARTEHLDRTTTHHMLSRAQEAHPALLCEHHGGDSVLGRVAPVAQLRNTRYVDGKGHAIAGQPYTPGQLARASTTT